MLQDYCSLFIVVWETILTIKYEGQPGVIDLPNNGLEAVERMLSFFYTSDYDNISPPLTSISSTNHEHLLHAKIYVLADKYDVPALKVIAAKKYGGCLEPSGTALQPPLLRRSSLFTKACRTMTTL